MQATTTWGHQHGNVADAEYADFLQRVNTRFAGNTKGVPVFTTRADPATLWDAYLGSFSDPHERQHHNCNTCRHFIQRFGGLAIMDADGRRLIPAVWNEDDAHEPYKAAVRAMARVVARSSVTGVFLSSEKTLGLPKTGVWTHLSVRNTAALAPSYYTAGQQMAQKSEDYRTVMRALAEFPLPLLDTAVQLLETDALYQNEKVMGPAKWLRDLKASSMETSGERLRNIVWRAVATAPAGFCHPRSSMIGTLLEDLAAGMRYEDVSRRFAAKMHPLRYQRPQAAPTAGNIAQAEKMFQEMGLAPALQRRIARFEEVPKMWVPRTERPAQAAAGSVFGHLTPKTSAPQVAMKMPMVTMTLRKFIEEVIPDAEKIQLALTSQRSALIAITTAVNPDAPKLFQWDHPFSWYVWHGGSSPTQYGLRPGWVNVSGVTRLPARYDDDGDRFVHHGDGVILLLEGAVESRTAGAALFPNHMRSELHAVRSTIESYSRDAEMQGLSEGTACGYDLRQGGSGFPAIVLVTSKSGRVQEYKIDRWD